MQDQPSSHTLSISGCFRLVNVVNSETSQGSKTGAVYTVRIHVSLNHGVQQRSFYK